jgi:hypothetical protein
LKSKAKEATLMQTAPEVTEVRVRFLCCVFTIEAEEYFEIAKKDEQGFEICPVHGERRYGWRSPTMNVKLHGGDEEVWLRRSDHHAAAIIMGFTPSNKPVKISVEDTRDNRDPQQMGDELATMRETTLHKGAFTMAEAADSL